MASLFSRAALESFHGLHTAWRAVRRDGTRLAVLMYHGVVEEPLEPFCWHQLPLGHFEAQMRFVARTCRVLPLTEALDRMAQGTLPHRACAITFDDGFLNNRTTAYPVLRDLDLPATIFVVTGKLGTQEVLWPDRLYLAVRDTQASVVDAAALGLGSLPLGGPGQRAGAIEALLGVLKTLPAAEKDAQLARLLEALRASEAPEPGPFALMGWDDVAALAADARITFGAHTTRHDLLSRLPDAAVEAEIRTSHADVTQRLDVEPHVFAYPNGRTIDFDERAKRVLRELGVPWALSTREALARTGADAHDVPRICVGAHLPFQRFRHLVGGTIDALMRRR